MKYIFYILMLGFSGLFLTASNLPFFSATPKNGGFKSFDFVSGNWKITKAGIHEITDKPDKECVARSRKFYFGPNSSLTVAANPLDNLGKTWIDFGCADRNNFLRIVHDAGSTTTVSLYLVKNGVKQLLAETNGLKKAIEPGDKTHYLHFKIMASKDVIQVKLNKTDLFCVHCMNIPCGGIELGVCGRKQIFRYISTRTYQNVTLYMEPAIVKDFELNVSHQVLRHNFYRDEKTQLEMTFINHTAKEVEVSQAVVTLPDSTKFKLSDAKVNPLDKKVWILPLDCSLWEGDCKIQFNAVVNAKKKLHADYPMFFGNRKKRDSYMFAAANIPATTYMIDFVHKNGANCFGFTLNPYENFEKNRTFLAQLNDEAIRRDMTIQVRFSVMMAVDPAKAKQFMVTIRPDGTKGKHLNCNDPKAQEYVLQCTERLAKILLDYPAFQYVVVNSEIENFLTLSCLSADKARCEKAFGRPVPKLESSSANIDSTDGIVLKVPEKVKKSMTPIVPANDILYQWMTFLWKKGFGDNLLHERIDKTFKKINPSLLTQHEPFRNYPVFNRNLGMDYCGTWYYMAPDAGPTFMAVESLLASMGGAKQKIDFCPSYHQYYWQFTPGKTPQAGTPPENFCMEAFFLGLASRVDVFSVFRYTFLLPETKLDYRQENLLNKTRDFSKNMAEPLWDSIRPMQRETTPVSMLLSSAGQIFGKRHWGGYGYALENEMLNLLWKANLPSNIIFEDNIRKNNDWKKCKLLVITTAKYLPDDVYKEICDYAKKGGKVVACPPFDKLIPNADTLDINFDFSTKSSLYSIHREKSPWTALKAQDYRLDTVRKLRDKYHCLVSVFADSDSPEVYLRTLQDADTHYVFALNDKRTEGSYMGRKFHAVLDAGVSQKATVVLNMKSGAVYEFPSGKRVNAKAANGKLKLDLNFAPTEGKVFFCYPEAMGKLTVSAAKNYTANVSLTSASGNPFRGTVPVRVCWKDPAGKICCEYTAIRNGKLQVSVNPGRNIRKGTWKCQIKELASGMTKEVFFP